MKRFSRWFILGFLTFWLIINWSPASSQSVSSPRLLVQQGQELYEQGEILGAIAHLKKAETQFRQLNNFSSLAITLTNLGQLQLTAGQPEAAIQTWEEALKLENYFPHTDLKQRLQIDRATAFIAMGMYGRACQNLKTVLDIEAPLCRQGETPELAISPPLDQNSVRGWRNLADSLRALGKYEQAQSILTNLNEQLSPSVEKDRVLLSLGETLQSLGNQERDRAIDAPLFNYRPWECLRRETPTTAQTFYRQAAQAYQKASDSSSIPTQAQLRQLALIQDTGMIPTDLDLTQITLSALPQGRESIYAQVHYAKSLACLAQKKSNDIPWQKLTQITQNALKQAQALKDDRAQAYALGNLAELYEYRTNATQQPQWAQKAQVLSEQALYLAQPETQPDLAYQRQWQQGRLLAKQGDIPRAISQLQAATTTLETVRSNLRAVDADVQFSFRDRVEPLYRQLIDLLSQESPLTSADRLEQALTSLDRLQLAELENFLDCNLSEFVAVEKVLDTLDPKAAFIAPILLEDRLEVIYKFPNQPLTHHRQQIPYEEVEALITRLRSNLTRPDRSFAVVQDSQTLYNWLIRPLESSLAQQPDLETLVFVSDGALRNIPPSVFHDGNSFLVERYETALISSRELFNPRPRNQGANVLLAGISEAQEVDGIEFIPLPAVTEEIQQLQEEIQTGSNVLLNQEFTKARLDESIDRSDFGIVHIATHGQFSSDPENTYLLAWGERILVQDIDTVLQISRPELGDNNGIDLLVLSACQTAQGNRRAALGLAGISTQAQVRSTLATLWQVDDFATALLINKFYENLNQGDTLATALRNAQLYLIQDLQETRPFFWSPFVLVGNWL